MSAIPETPAEFFTHFLPSRFAALSSITAGRSSAGSIVFRVLGAGDWSARIVTGALQIEAGAADDAVVQLTVRADDFATFYVEGARLGEAAAAAPERQVIAFKALSIDGERAKLIRQIPGGLAFVVDDGGVARRLAVTPGLRAPKLEDAECRLELAMADFRGVQAGKVQPMQLLGQGKLKIVGNAQIPLALSSLFA